MMILISFWLRFQAWTQRSSFMFCVDRRRESQIVTVKPKIELQKIDI